MSDKLDDALRAFGERDAPPVPDAVVAQARAQAEALRSRRSRTLRGRALWTAAVGMTIGAASMTAPGRAATDWIGELAGVGENPSATQRDVVRGSPVVLRSGRLSDGTPYELVAKRIDGRSIRPTFGRSGPFDEAICFQVDWVGTGSGGEGGACRAIGDSGAGSPPLESSAFLQPPGAEPSAPGIFFGILQPDEPPIATVRVVFEPRSGSERQLESELIDVSDRSFDSLGENASGRIFVSVIDGELVAQELRGKARIYAAARDGGGDEVARAALHDPLDVVALRDLLERELPQDLEPNEVSRLLGISGREVEEALPTGRLNSHSLRRTLERLLVARARSRRG